MPINVDFCNVGCKIKCNVSVFKTCGPNNALAFVLEEVFQVIIVVGSEAKGVRDKGMGRG